MAIAKLSTALLLATLTSCALGLKLSQVAPGAGRNVIYMDYYLANSEDLYEDITAVVDAGFNVINLAFVLNDRVWDVAQIWAEVMNDAQRQRCLKYAHDRGAIIMASMGGSTNLLVGDMIEGHNVSGQTAQQYCTNAAVFTTEFDLDGLDMDIELRPGDQEGFYDGSALAFISECTQIAADVFGYGQPGYAYEITHAPQGPYMGTWAYLGEEDTTSYIAVHNAVGHLIDAYNVQYYNQGATLYTSYDEIFLAGEHEAAWESAILEMNAKGIPFEKLVLGKPLTEVDANNGRIEIALLSHWVSRAGEEFGWRGGVMTWQYRRYLPETPLTALWGRAMSDALGNSEPGSEEPCTRRRRRRDFN